MRRSQSFMASPGRSGRLAFLVVAAALVAALPATDALAAPVAGPAAAAATCGLPGSGPLSRSAVPEGTSAVKCGLVGRVVRAGGVGVAIPAPGIAVSASQVRVDGSEADLEVSVSVDGKISYGGGDVTVRSPAAAAVADADDPAACSDSAYVTQDRIATSAYAWYVGDGGMPANLTRAEAAVAFEDAIDNITDSHNDCGLSDLVSAAESWQGLTAKEANVDADTQCLTRDEVSVWDAGDLSTGVLAVTCSYTKVVSGAKNPLLEADVRFNTHDYDFTNSPGSSCSGLYDIRAVGTHEAGHVFGLGHVSTGHSNLTMYTNISQCSTAFRTLGRGDILALRSMY